MIPARCRGLDGKNVDDADGKKVLHFDSKRIENADGVSLALDKDSTTGFSIRNPKDHSTIWSSKT